MMGVFFRPVGAFVKPLWAAVQIMLVELRKVWILRTSIELKFFDFSGSSVDDLETALLVSDRRSHPLTRRSLHGRSALKQTTQRLDLTGASWFRGSSCFLMLFLMFVLCYISCLVFARFVGHHIRQQKGDLRS